MRDGVRGWRREHVHPRLSTLVLGAIFVLSLTVYFLIRPDPSNSSRSCPAGPTNGRPVASSRAPGPSPTRSTSLTGFPSPGTVSVRPR